MDKFSFEIPVNLIDNKQPLKVTVYFDEQKMIVNDNEFSGPSLVNLFQDAGLQHYPHRIERLIHPSYNVLEKEAIRRGAPVDSKGHVYGRGRPYQTLELLDAIYIFSAPPLEQKKCEHCGK